MAAPSSMTCAESKGWSCLSTRKVARADRGWHVHIALRLRVRVNGSPPFDYTVRVSGSPPFDHAARVCIRVCRANSASGGRPPHLPVSAEIVAPAASGHS